MAPYGVWISDKIRREYCEYLKKFYVVTLACWMEIFRDLLLCYFFTVYLIPALLIALAELLDDLVGVIAPFAVWISVVNILAQPKSPIGWISLWGGRDSLESGPQTRSS